MDAVLATLDEAAPGSVDLVNAGHLDFLRRSAEELEIHAGTADALSALESTVNRETVSIASQVAVKLALSRMRLRDLSEPVHLSLVFAVYKEHNRIQTADEHPHGEDFLRRKLKQLHWLFDGTAHDWDLVIVDDGCPEESGRIAEGILQGSPDQRRVQIQYLQDAIDQELPIARGLTSTAESRKGGSIRYGLWSAVRVNRNGVHVVAFTDADLSTHLGQTGLLVDSIVRHNRIAAIGSRREATSVVVKQRSRSDRGKLFIYIWKQILPQLKGIIDTQCGFKAFRAAHLRSWIAEMTEHGFAFDIEYLLNVNLRDPGSVQRVPVAWIDSEEESTTTDIAPYLTMLQSVAQFYRRYLPRSERAEAFAHLVESMDEASFQRLLDRIPDALLAREPREYEGFCGVSAEELLGASRK